MIDRPTLTITIPVPSSVMAHIDPDDLMSSSVSLDLDTRTITYADDAGNTVSRPINDTDKKGVTANLLWASILRVEAETNGDSSDVRIPEMELF